MEDIKIKEFDRAIEKMMNESSVAPPYGLWNRVSAQLGAQPGPAPASTGFGKTFYFLTTGLAMIGASLLTAYLVMDTPTQQTVVVEPVRETTLTETPEVITLPAEEKPVVVASVPATPHREVVKKVTIPAVIPAAKAIADEAPLLAAVAVSKEVDAIERAVPLTETVQHSAITPDVKPVEGELTPTPAKSSLKAKVEEDDDTETDTRVNQYGDKKLKFRPQRKQKFRYSPIIRSRKHKSHF